MKKLHNYPSMLGFTLLACLLMITAELCILCKSTLMKPEFYMDNIRESKADEAICGELDAYFTQLQNPTDIPKEVFVKSMTYDKISGSAKQLAKASILYIIGRSASKPEVQYDFDAFENDITQYVESFSEENGIKKDDEYYKLIDNVVDAGETQIKSRLDVMMLKQLADSPAASGIRKLAPNIVIGIVMSLICLAAVIFAMYIIDKEHPFDLFYWVGCTMFASAAVLLAPSLYLKISGFFDGFFVENESIYLAMTGLLYGVIDKVITANIVIGALGIIMMVAAQVIHKIRVSF